MRNSTIKIKSSLESYLYTCVKEPVCQSVSNLLEVFQITINVILGDNSQPISMNIVRKGILTFKLALIL